VTHALELALHEALQLDMQDLRQLIVKLNTEYARRVIAHRRETLKRPARPWTGPEGKLD
jgi:hypothetical protein